MRIIHDGFEGFMRVGAAAVDHPALIKGQLKREVETRLSPLIGTAALLASSSSFSCSQSIDDFMFDAHAWLFYSGLVNRYGAWAKFQTKCHPGFYEARYFQFDIKQVELTAQAIEENLNALLPAARLQAIVGHLISDGVSGSYWDAHKTDLLRLAAEEPALAKLALAGHLHRVEQPLFGSEHHATIVRHAIIWAVADLVRIALYILCLNDAGRMVIAAANMATPLHDDACGDGAIEIDSSFDGSQVHVRSVISAAEAFLKPVIQLSQRAADLQKLQLAGIAISPRRDKRSKAAVHELPTRAWGSLLTALHNYLVGSRELEDVLGLDDEIGAKNGSSLILGRPMMDKMLATMESMRASRPSAASTIKPLTQNVTLAEHHLLGFASNEAIWLVAAQADAAIGILKVKLAQQAAGNYRGALREARRVGWDEIKAKMTGAAELMVEVARRELLEEADGKAPDWWNDDLNDGQRFIEAQQEQLMAGKLKTARKKALKKLQRLKARKRTGAALNATENLSLSFRQRS